MVMPRSRSSGALSIESNERNWILGLCFDNTLVMAAVSVVLPWSTCPIVPTFTCGLLRSNFSLLMFAVLRRLFLDDNFGDVRRNLGVLRELHGEGRAALAHRAHRRRVAEHLRQRHVGGDRLASRRLVHPHDLPAAAIQVADHI